jgi:hypothetical protein
MWRILAHHSSRSLAGKKIRIFASTSSTSVIFGSPPSGRRRSARWFWPEAIKPSPQRRRLRNLVKLGPLRRCSCSSSRFCTVGCRRRSPSRSHRTRRTRNRCSATTCSWTAYGHHSAPRVLQHCSRADMTGRFAVPVPIKRENISSHKFFG